MTVLDDRPVVTTGDADRMAGCPSWCGEHVASRAGTWHWSALHKLLNPFPDNPNQDVILRAELYTQDTGNGGEARLLLTGENEANLSAAEADIVIGQLAAFLDTVRVLRRQMG